ncbi:unnamed protein product [Cochlearia groenlandica]
MSVFIIFFLLHLILTSLCVSGQKLNVYEVLQKYKLPRGILPHGVTDYELNTNSGRFIVYFNGTCQFPIDTYKLKYDSTISGVITPGHVRQLRGVSIKVLFFWLNLEHVARDGDELDFSVGVASEELPVRNFVDSPKCGCGFYCTNLLFSS